MFDPEQSSFSIFSTAVIVVSVIFLLLSLLAVAVRFKARRGSKQGLKGDDWTILVTWIFSLGLSIMTWILASFAGVNVYKGSVVKGTEYSFEALALASSLFMLPLTAVKISILLFYKRIFTKPGHLKAIWAMIALVLIWGILFFFLTLFQSDPVQSSWTGVGHFRFNSNSLGLAQGITSILLDAIILSIPIPLVVKLHLDSTRKLMVIAVFWLGGFCLIAAIVRVVLLQNNTRTVIAADLQGVSVIYIQANLFVFFFLEVNCSIIGACLPCYGPLLIGGRSPESIIHSVRSVLSLGSRRSKSLHERDGSTNPSTSGRTDSTDLHVINVTRQVEIKNAPA